MAIVWVGVGEHWNTSCQCAPFSESRTECPESKVRSRRQRRRRLAVCCTRLPGYVQNRMERFVSDGPQIELVDSRMFPALHAAAPMLQAFLGFVLAS